MKIKLLSNELSNQIAAGEVVERPASVIKELIENAIDANATEINIHLEKGGLKSIIVNDNGHGIDKEDLPRTVWSHATSKIASSSDLESIETLGFRGEALASINAVSHFSITSRTADAPHSWKFSDGDVQPSAGTVGTNVSIRELFYNLPARRKFMRSESTEFRQCLNTIHRLSLGWPHCGFSVSHNQRNVFKCAAGTDEESFKQRILQICGEEFKESMIAIDVTQGDLRLHGFLAKPVFSRPQGNMQYWFVNNRIVRDKLLSGAAKRAYRDQMYHDRFPAFICYLQLPPNAVDVNVHPEKSEVRFRDTNIFSFIQQAIHHVITRPIKDSAKGTPLVKKNIPVLENPKLPMQKASYSSYQANSSNNPQSFQDYALFVKDSNPLEYTSVDTEHPLGEAVAYIHGVFIISMTQNGMCVVDAHGAHERILYQKLKKHLDATSLTAQQLLVPISLSLSANEFSVLQMHQSHFESLKFIIEPASNSAAIIRQIPSILINSDIKKTVLDALSDLSLESVHSERIQTNIDSFLSTIACHAAVRANRPMNITEMNLLLRQLENTESGEVCNHGRPIIRNFNMSEMNSWFKRGQ